MDGQKHCLEIVDTAGQEEFANFRNVTFSHGQAFILVYAINDLQSWEELKEMRTKILRIKDVDSCPMIVAGNKSVRVHWRCVLLRHTAYAPFSRTGSRRGPQGPCGGRGEVVQRP